MIETPKTFLIDSSELVASSGEGVLYNEAVSALVSVAPDELLGLLMLVGGNNSSTANVSKKWEMNTNEIKMLSDLSTGKVAVEGSDSSSWNQVKLFVFRTIAAQLKNDLVVDVMCNNKDWEKSLNFVHELTEVIPEDIDMWKLLKNSLFTKAERNLKGHRIAGGWINGVFRHLKNKNELDEHKEKMAGILKMYARKVS